MRMGSLAKPVSQIYSGLAQIKNYFFDTGLMDSMDLKTPVVSVGNLTVGGTGKTPITQMIIDHYKTLGKKAVVVGRNYKSLFRGLDRVDINKPMAAQHFGDEPTLLAMRNPEVPVFVGPAKWLTAYTAEEQEKPDVIIVDDGFQHRRLHRDVDIVLLDATAPLSDYELLPLGKGREDFSSVTRAQWVFLTKVNMANEVVLEELRQRIPKSVKTMEVSYRLQGGPLEEAGFKAVLFAGLGKPESFKLSVQQDTLYEIAEFVPFPDHHAYTHDDIDFLRKVKEKAQAQVFLTTEKDWTKVKNLVSDTADFRVMNLETHFLGDPTEFYADLDKAIN